MIRPDMIKLNENTNKWVLGSRPAAIKLSNTLQIKYNLNPKSKLEKEVWHKHINTIEECYLVLNGEMKIKIEHEIFTLKQREMLHVPPNFCHKIIWCTENLEYLTIRAPPSDSSTKILCDT